MEAEHTTPVVWIVDDSRTDAERARQALADRYQVVLFSDGAAVVEALAQRIPPQVILLDVLMPDVSGIEVCRFVRQGRPETADLPIILLTAQRDPDEIAEGLAAGANDFVSKPFHEAELRARVSAVVHTRQLVLRSERAEARVRELMSQAPDALLAFDDRGLLVAANLEATRVFAAPQEALTGRSIRELLPGLQDGDLPVAQRGGEAVLLPDVALGGRVFAPMMRATDIPAGFTISLRDVTETRREETRRLDFYSMVAHDLRSPLTAILLRSSLIRRGKHGILPAGLLGDIEKIESTIHSLVALINDFLDLARLQGAGLKLAREELDVVAVVEEALDELRPLADASGLTLQLSVPIERIRVLGDRRRLGQVLANLLSNAIKFTSAGGWLRVQVAEGNGSVQVGIQDNGPGIPAEDLPTLFDRFTRARSTEHKVVGTGLGLMIVRQIVEAHGGRVWVESKLGQGSAFWFEIPKPSAPGTASPDEARRRDAFPAG